MQKFDEMLSYQNLKSFVVNLISKSYIFESFGLYTISMLQLLQEKNNVKI